VGLFFFQLSLARGLTSRVPWLRWSNETAIKPFDFDADRPFQSWIEAAAIGAMIDWTWSRG